MRVERLAQLVEARVGELGLRGLRGGDDIARAVHHEHVVDAEKLLVRDHLGVGRLKARAILRRVGNLRRLGLVNGIVLLGVLDGLARRGLQKPGERLLLGGDLVGIARPGKGVLHAG